MPNTKHKKQCRSSQSTPVQSSMLGLRVIVVEFSETHKKMSNVPRKLSERVGFVDRTHWKLCFYVKQFVSKAVKTMKIITHLNLNEVLAILVSLKAYRATYLFNRSVK